MDVHAPKQRHTDRRRWLQFRRPVQHHRFWSLIGKHVGADSGTNCNKDITICLNTPAMSTGEFSLSAGSYSIDGTVLASPFTGGTAFFEVTTSVPEPASLSLLATSLAGFAGFAFLRRR